MRKYKQRESVFYLYLVFILGLVNIAFTVY